jgi:hypothetical protein
MDWSKGKTLLWTGQLTLIKDLSSYHLVKTSTLRKKLIELLVSLASIVFLKEKVFFYPDFIVVQTYLLLLQKENMYSDVCSI